MLPAEVCYRAAQSKDARFDGMFFVAVRTTRIYCRPSCPARTPNRENVIFVPTAASAQVLGYRACKRCRPDVSPGSPEWNLRGDVVARAMRLINDGLVDRDGVAALAERLSYSERQLRRLMIAEIGAAPIALARARRADVARVLLESTRLRIGEVAFASGFSSLRQFNDTMRELADTTPSALRAKAARRSGARAQDRAISLRLAHREPFDGAALLAYFAARAVPGVEEVIGGTYRRVLDLPYGPGIVELALCPPSPTVGYIDATLKLSDMRDLSAGVARCRFLADLDADPVAIDESLRNDAIIGGEVRAHPGRRVPKSPDGNELAVRALLGQQVSVQGARTLCARLVATYGKPLNEQDGRLTHVFPSADVLANVDPADLAMPYARKQSFIALNEALAGKKIVLDYGVDREHAHQVLQSLKGIGPWTADYIAMRALGDPDAFASSDLGVRRAFEAASRRADPASVAAYAQRWRPWRAYALQHLWATLSERKAQHRDEAQH